MADVVKRPAAPLLEYPSALPITSLELDELNPRLAVADRGNSQQDLVGVLWKEMAVDEVAMSIANNGFFQEEPLFVIPKDAKDKQTDLTKRKYIVVEGNRRLAAVMLLLDKDLQREVGATNLPNLSAADREALKTLPVSVYKSREDLWQYFGFRHINGPKPWDAFSKARYVAEVHEQYGVPLKAIADSIGDRHTTVQRLYRGFKLLEQAESAGRFSTDDRVRGRFYFSHLYTAADQPEFQKFLGITGDGSLKKNPVPRAKLSELAELMLWLYGSKSEKKPPVITSQNPDLNILREVISRPSGLAALRSGFSLERARATAIGDPRRFREALVRAREDMREAKGSVTNGYKGENDLWDTISELVPLTESVKKEMADKRQAAAGRSR